MQTSPLATLKGTHFVAQVERDLRDMPPTAPGWGRLILREFLFQAKSLDALSAGTVWALLQGN